MAQANPKVVIIGAGYAGLAAAACLAKEGFEVTVLEKNTQLGGRARMFEAAGFRFDMGPSWYWMRVSRSNKWKRSLHAVYEMAVGPP